jgi:hypothetical protein
MSGGMAFGSAAGTRMRHPVDPLAQTDVGGVALGGPASAIFLVTLGTLVRQSGFAAGGVSGKPRYVGLRRGLDRGGTNGQPFATAVNGARPARSGTSTRDGGGGGCK